METQKNDSKHQLQVISCCIIQKMHHKYPISVSSLSSFTLFIKFELFMFLNSNLGNEPTYIEDLLFFKELTKSVEKSVTIPDGTEYISICASLQYDVNNTSAKIDVLINEISVGYKSDKYENEQGQCTIQGIKKVKPGDVVKCKFTSGSNLFGIGIFNITKITF